MVIGPGTKVGVLIDKYPFLLEVLSEYTPKFQNLKNPFMRKTFGRIATLANAASMGDVEIAPLLEHIAKTIRERTGEEVNIDSGSMVPQDPVAGPEAPGAMDRIEVLKDIMRDLHAGGDMDELTERFSSLVKDVSPVEIAEMEQQLVAEGMPEEEIKRLCDVHAEMFRKSLEAIDDLHTPPGHPVHTMRLENQALAEAAHDLRLLIDELGDSPGEEDLKAKRGDVASALDALSEVEKHYLRKEYQVFPLLERHGVEAPPKVMWAVHDDIRALFKEVRQHLQGGDGRALVKDARELVRMMGDMFFKEEKILIPMCLDIFTQEDWIEVHKGGKEFGYSLITPVDEWRPDEDGEPLVDVERSGDAREEGEEVRLSLPTGHFSLSQLSLMLNSLPIDITLVDDKDEVLYYSEGERVFPRSPGIIGRRVQNCHPPTSVHKVQQILDEFKAGSQDVAEFWLETGGRFVHIRYFALRDADGKYKGTLEMVQDATGIRRLKGERRLLDW